MIFSSIDLNKNCLDRFLESLEDIRESKFDGVEICLWEDMTQHSIDIRDALHKADLQANVHNDMMRMEQGIDNCERKLRYSLKFKKNIGAKLFISHPIKPYSSNLTRTRELFEKFEEEILVENVNRIRVPEIQSLGRPMVLDIGNLARNKECMQLRSYGGARWVHLHDYRDGQDHLPLGEGSLDLRHIITSFRGNGFTIELGSEFRKWIELREDYRKSIDYLNNILISNDSYGKNVRLEHLLKHAKGDRFDVAVDFGCGEGYLLHNINARIKKGYDITPKRIFNDLFYAEHNITFPIQECANLAICSEVIEHLLEDNEALKNIYNALMPRGKIFLTTVNKNTSKDKSELDRERAHLRRYGGELKMLMETQGFETISFYPFRSKHYYDNKRDFTKYCLEEDVLQGEKDASGWVYFGIKGGKK